LTQPAPATAGSCLRLPGRRGHRCAAVRPRRRRHRCTAVSYQPGRRRHWCTAVRPRWRRHRCAAVGQCFKTHRTGQNQQNQYSHKRPLRHWPLRV